MNGTTHAMRNIITQVLHKAVRLITNAYNLHKPGRN